MNACIDWSMIHGARAEHERDAGAVGCWRWTLWLCGRVVGGEVRARLAEGKGCHSLTESRYMAESALADSGHENRELVHYEILERQTEQRKERDHD